ncbi:hypothetical protein EPUS_03370 [Endocarpon pusillum Z07020]|uniref:Uncharacterized protein n=1 Tax=Endocarpon pusillum (strain Z07020 / HMAS-L-300199) TaxID=1263415 RepID=U1HU95_ENDPU|nr:uncharacterized protein EPUS_03370 [Endocarpon pusillum Z07020]ERF74180.1 hypothetical protein EPUS_03370 [Endocarpon pusillum Z07020]
MSPPPRDIYEHDVDFTELALQDPAFAKKLKPNKQLDFSDPESVLYDLSTLGTLFCVICPLLVNDVPLLKKVDFVSSRAIPSIQAVGALADLSAVFHGQTIDQVTSPSGF